MSEESSTTVSSDIETSAVAEQAKEASSAADNRDTSRDGDDAEDEEPPSSFLIVELKREKIRKKRNFTNARRSLLVAMREGDDISSVRMRAELTDRTQQELMDILSSIEDLCVQSKDIRNLAKTVAEMEEVEAEKSQADNQLDVFWSKLEMSDVLLAQRQYGLLDFGEEMPPQEYESTAFGRNANPGETTSLSLSSAPVSGEWSVGALGNVTSSHRTGPVMSSASVSGMQLPASATTLPTAQAISPSITTGISSLTSTTPYVTAVIQVPDTHVTAAMPVPSTEVTLPTASVRLPVNTRALPPVTTHASASVRSSAYAFGSLPPPAPPTHSTTTVWSRFQGVQGHQAPPGIRSGPGHHGTVTSQAQFPQHQPLQSQQPASSQHTTALGQDMWRQLKRVSIPVFRGDKRQYESWKAAFLACIDGAPLTPEYKLLQLREYLAGDAQKVVENLGHSAAAYQAAKDRLERKYGGNRRKMALHLEELDKFKGIRVGSARDVEAFADLLDVAVINLKGAGRTDELRDGSFYAKLLTKMTEPMVANYQRWLFEQRAAENVETLLTWVTREAEYVAMAAEAVRGVSSTNPHREPAAPGRQSNFHGTTNSRSCPLCTGLHGIWACETFKKQSVSQRWVTAKAHKLCYRCLTSGHSGRDCSNGRKCGIDNCSFTHNRLLHGRDSVNSGSSRSRATAAKSPARVTERQAHEQTSCSTTTEHTATTLLSMEGEESSSKKATFAASTANLQEVVGLRTVPVILHYDGKEIATNALLDDGSTATFLNAKVAAELGLVGDTQEVTVDMLNEKHATFSSKLVTVRLKSPDGTVDEEICARTADRIAANLPVVDWKQHASSWQHLSHIEFPRINRRRPIDLLIGIDNAQFHRCKAEVTGGDGEPIARLTPLGWTCVGKPSPSEPSPQRTVHSQSFLVNKLSRPEADNNLERLVRKFWGLLPFSQLIPQTTFPLRRTTFCTDKLEVFLPQ